MKKILLICLSLLMLFVACGNDEDTNKSEVSGTITVVTNFTEKEEIFEEIEAKFIEKYPDVEEIIWESTGGDYDEYITTRMSSGNYGDVLVVPFSMTRNPEELENFLLPLDTTENLSEDYLLADQAVYGDNAYALPISLNTLGILYNQEVFETAGIEEVPTSSEEVYEAAKLIKDNTEAIPWYTNLNTVPMFWSGAVTSYGGEQYMSDILAAGTIVEEGQPYREILDFVHTMVKSGYTEADPMTGDLMISSQMVANGDAGFIIMGSQELKNIMDMADNPDHIKMAPFPVQFNDASHMPVGADGLVGISNKTENEATARAFYEFLLSLESGFATDNGGFSPQVGSEKSAPDYLSYQLSDYEMIRTIASEDADVITEFQTVSNAANIPSITDTVVDVAVVAQNNEDYDAFLQKLEETWENAIKETE